jgi:hypothetical protein
VFCRSFRQTKQIKENRKNNDLQNTTQKFKERQTIQRRIIKEQKDKQRSTKHYTEH